MSGETVENIRKPRGWILGLTNDLRADLWPLLQECLRVVESRRSLGRQCWPRGGMTRGCWVLSGRVWWAPGTLVERSNLYETCAPSELRRASFRAMRRQASAAVSILGVCTVAVDKMGQHGHVRLICSLISALQLPQYRSVDRMNMWVFPIVHKRSIVCGSCL